MLYRWIHNYFSPSNAYKTRHDIAWTQNRSMPIWKRVAPNGQYHFYEFLHPSKYEMIIFCKIKFDSLTYFYFLFNSDFDCFRPKQFDCCLMRWVHRDTVRYRHVEFITIHYSWLILFTRHSHTEVRILPLFIWETFHHYIYRGMTASVQSFTAVEQFLF